jgi:hypothetical protein
VFPLEDSHFLVLPTFRPGADGNLSVVSWRGISQGYLELILPAQLVPLRLPNQHQS